jgi:uncharacterized phage infection (PIP) family protein YhgE
VAADEVRKLAERTTTATKEIAEMIKSIQSGTSGAAKAMENASLQVEQGVASTERAGESLQQIIQMSEQVGAMITDIATGARQQSSATAEINHNMDQIAGLVKESTVGSQESAKACHYLSDLASDLQSMVDSFKREAGSENRRSSGGGHQIRSSSHRKEGLPRFHLRARFAQPGWKLRQPAGSSLRLVERWRTFPAWQWRSGSHTAKAAFFADPDGARTQKP